MMYLKLNKLKLIKINIITKLKY